MSTNAVKEVADWISAGVVVSTFFEVLPAVAAILSIVWTSIRIYEWWKGKQNANERINRLDP